MTTGTFRLVVVALITAASLSAASAEPSAKPEGGGDASVLSSEFWSDWKTLQASDSFHALNEAAGSTQKTNAAIAEGTTAHQQSIANIAVDKPEDVAKLLSGVAATPASAENQAAVATVLTMRTTATAREAAAPLIAPEVKAQVQVMTANLSTGIAGLPGIYLGDNAEGNGARSTAQDGYAPVAGGSMGCPAH